jgi:hypothetical protein
MSEQQRPVVPQQREPVRWGCHEHRTPAGQDCEHCAQQGELFARADAGRSTYRRKR